MSGTMVLVITRLHFSQAEALGRSRRLILTFSEARVDLAKGFLHVALAGDASSPFDAEVGFALLEQAIPDLQETEAALAGHLPELTHSGVLPAFRAKVEGLRAMLAVYRQRPGGERRELELPLYLRFHETEELAGRLEGRVRDDLQALGTRQNARFALTLGSAFVLLGAICAGVYAVSRREAGAIEALLRSEQRLKETNGFLSDLIEHSAAVIFVKDRDGHYELVNRRWEEETGIGREQALGKTDPQLFPGPVGELFRAHDRRVVESGQPLELEESAGEGPAGRTFVSVKFPVRSGDGHIRGVCGIATDITARKQAEEALRRSETHLRTLVNTLPDLVWLKDPQGVYLSCNARFEALFGAAEDAICGRTDYDFVSRELADFFRQHDLAALAAGGPCVNEEELTFVADGHREILETIKTPMRDADGNVIGVLGIARDITERRRTALALKASERALSEAQRIAEIGSWEWDVRAGRHTWSDRVYQIYGRDLALPPAVFPEVSGYFTPESWARLAAVVEQALADGRPYECDAEVVRPDGTHRWITARGEAERDAGGAIACLRGTVQDITERKQAERALRESEMRRTLALDAAKAGIWEWELASGKNHWSDELWRLYGLTPNFCEPSYEAWRESVHPEDRATLERVLQEAVGREDEIRLEWRVNLPAGEDRWLMSRGRPVRDDAGRVAHYLGVVIDITERKQAEESARQNAARLNFALQASHTGAWSLNVEERTATRTLIHAQIFGYPDANAAWDMDQFMAHVLPEDREQVRQHLQVGIARRTGWSFDCRIRRTDGQVRWILVVGGWEQGSTKARVSGIIQDITERKLLEQERVVMEAQLRQQQKLESIGTLASGVAHEINNPITGIMNYAQLIQDRLPGDSPLTEFTGEIMRETQRVATIVRHLLTFARQERQSHSPARLVDIVDAVLSLVRTVIGRDRIILQVTIPKDLPSLKCRSQQIQQVIMNLVTNARDALNDRYPGHHPDKVLSLHASLRPDGDRRWIRLTVEDHGTGIAPEVRERIFDPFFTTKGRDAGTGLGLSISHGIVKEHRGEWTVESEPGRFTRMHIDLPADNGWEI
jgi:PAS domain S-box-containing protein